MISLVKSDTWTRTRVGYEFRVQVTYDIFTANNPNYRRRKPSYMCSTKTLPLNHNHNPETKTSLRGKQETLGGHWAIIREN